MALAPLIVLFVIIVILYKLVVEGLFFKLILLVAGSICMWIVLSAQPELRATAFTLGGMQFSTASAIVLGVVLGVLLTTKEN